MTRNPFFMAHLFLARSSAPRIAPTGRSVKDTTRVLGCRTMADTADVVVVGGGVIGTSIAFALASAGVARVTLLEKGALASGASGRSSALIRMHYVNEEDARLAWASFPVFRDWCERMGGPPVFTPTGFVAVVDPADAAALRANVEMLRKIGVDTTAMSPAELTTLQPHVNVDDVGAAAYGRHRPRARHLLQAGGPRPDDRGRAVPGLGHRSRHDADRPAADGAGGGRAAAHASHARDGARRARAWLSSLRLLQRRPPRDPRRGARRRRSLSGHRVQRLWLQDRTGRRRLCGRADHRGPRSHRRHLRVSSRALRRGPPHRGPAPVRAPPRPSGADALTAWRSTSCAACCKRSRCWSGSPSRASCCCASPPAAPWPSTRKIPA